jgi:hypothetical protein
MRETATMLNRNLDEPPSQEQAEMADSLYYLATISYYGLAVFGACVIPDVDIIFEFVAAVCINCLTFIFPSVFYLKARKMFPESQSSSILVACSYL